MNPTIQIATPKFGRDCGFSFPIPTIKTSRRYFLLLIRACNLKVFISRHPLSFHKKKSLTIFSDQRNESMFILT